MAAVRDNSTDLAAGATQPGTTVQLELPLPVLCRLLRERNLAACEFRCLDPDSHRAGCWAVKCSCTSR